jgi:hypothetical protein
MKDHTYQAFFANEDLPVLTEMITRLNITHDTYEIEELNEVFEANVTRGKGKGKSSPAAALILSNGKKLRPCQVIKSDDLVCNNGIDQALDLMRGVASARFRYLGLGYGGNVTPSVLDTTLVTEHTAVSRIDMNDLQKGWREPSGLKMLFGGILGEITALTVTEFGIFTSSTGGQMLNHNNFQPRSISRSSLRFILFFSSVIEFVPKATGI